MRVGPVSHTAHSGLLKSSLSKKVAATGFLIWKWDWSKKKHQHPLWHTRSYVPQHNFVANRKQKGIHQQNPAYNYHTDLPPSSKTVLPLSLYSALNFYHEKSKYRNTWRMTPMCVFTTHREQTAAFFIFASYLFLRNEISPSVQVPFVPVPELHVPSSPRGKHRWRWCVCSMILCICYPHHLSPDTHTVLYFNLYT